MYKPALISLLSVLLIFISACGEIVDLGLEATSVQDQDFSKETIYAASHQTVKPGAAVIFTSEFSGPLSVGEIAPIMIQLAPEYVQGNMSVEIVGAKGLMVQGETSFTRSFTEGEQVLHELLVSAEASGEYRLGIVASVVTASGLEEVRAFSEIISVGAETNTESLESVKENLVELNAIQSQQIDSEPSYLEAIEEVYIAP